MIALYRRFASLDRSRRRLVVEAAALIAAACIGVRLLRFLTLVRILDRCAAALARARGVETEAIDSVRWAVSAVAAHVPPATCLVRALAAGAMLRRRGVAGAIRFGVRASRGPAAAGRHVPRIDGHAWIECRDGTTIGIEPHAGYAVMSPARTP